MTVELYHTISNSHTAEGVFAYVPQDRLLIQGDFYDVSWEIYWWQDTYMDKVRYRHLQVVLKASACSLSVRPSA